MKKISLNTTIYKLTNAYPEIIEVLFALGFSDITKPMMINTVGRIMTINKGARMKNISVTTIISALEEAGFTVTEEENE